MSAKIRNGFTRNWRYYTYHALVSAPTFFVGLIGSGDTLYALATGHSFTEDATPPEIHSTVTTIPYCLATLVQPTSTVVAKAIERSRLRFGR